MTTMRYTLVAMSGGLVAEDIDDESGSEFYMYLVVDSEPVPGSVEGRVLARCHRADDARGIAAAMNAGVVA